MSRAGKEHQPVSLDLGADYRSDVHSRNCFRVGVRDARQSRSDSANPAGSEYRFRIVWLGFDANLDHDFRSGSAANRFNEHLLCRQHAPTDGCRMGQSFAGLVCQAAQEIPHAGEFNSFRRRHHSGV